MPDSEAWGDSYSQRKKWLWGTCRGWAAARLAVRELRQAPSFPRYARRKRCFLIRWKLMLGYKSIRSKVLERVKSWISDPVLPSIGMWPHFSWSHFPLLLNQGIHPDQPQIPYLNFFFSGILKFNVDRITLERIQNTCKVCSELQTTCSSLLAAWFYFGLAGRRRLHCIFVHMHYEWWYQKCRYQVLALLFPDGDTISFILQVFVRRYSSQNCVDTVYQRKLAEKSLAIV